MKSFKLLTVLAGILALAALSSCAEKVEDPFIKIEGEKTFDISKEQKAITVQVLSNRDWKVSVSEKASDWIVVEPASGKASDKATDVTITVLANTGANRSTAIEFRTGTASEMITINQEGPEGNTDGIESLTVAEFISRGGNGDTQTYYRLSGTVSAFKTGTSAAGKDYMQFNLTDDSGTILVYGFEGGQYEEWVNQIKNGGSIVLHGRYQYYQKEGSSTGQHEVVSTTIDSFTAGEEQTEITSATIAEFIATASETVYYRLTGTVSGFKTGNSNGRNYMQFDLTDDSSTIVVYGFEDGEYDKWATKIKDNGTVVLVGTYYLFGDSKHEVMNAKVESFTEGEAPQAVTVTVTEAIALPDKKPVIIAESTVVGISTMGIVVTDGTSYAYIYFKKDEVFPDVALGDKVKVEATKDTYNDVPEFVTATVTKLSAGECTYPEPKDLNPIATTYTSSVTEYVKLTGNLTIDKEKGYYNLEIPGVGTDTKQGSISGPLAALGIDAMEGSDITVTGFFIGLASKGKYINILATEATLADPDAKYCTVTPATINVKADVTSATFEVKANAAWTAVSDNDAFTLEPASGDGNATVTVSFAANDGDAPRVANITVTCAEAEVETVVVLTQAKPSSGDATVIAVDFTSVISDLPQGKDAGLQDGTYTLGGYEFKMHAGEKFYQAVSSGKYYLLIGKTDSYVQLPVVEGKALTKIEFLTGASASENVIVDVAKSDGTPLNVNSNKLKQGQTYTWEIAGEAGMAYRLLVTNNYNAQFQTLTLTYE